MTFWDLANKFIEKGGLAWTLLVIVLAGLVWLIAHPDVVKAWNVQISMWIAACVPKKRKRAFEKRLNLTIDSARKKFSEAVPPFMQRFLPYSHLRKQPLLLMQQASLYLRPSFRS